MSHLLWVAFVLCMVGSHAFAVDLNIPSGNYGGAFYKVGDPSEFSIVKRGSVAQFTDHVNSIIYSVDLANPNPQDVPDAYLRLMRKNPGTRIVGQIIKRITLTDLAQFSPTQLTGNINLHIESTSHFGTLRMIVKIGVVLVTTSCQAARLEGQNYSQINTTCIAFMTGAPVTVTKFSTGLGQSVDQSLGLFADLIMKILSVKFHTSGYLAYLP